MGAVEVLDASTGFWLMKREVVDRMIEGYPELFYLNDSSIDPKFNQYCYSFFDTIHDPDDNRYLSEGLYILSSLAKNRGFNLA